MAGYEWGYLFTDAVYVCRCTASRPLENDDDDGQMLTNQPINIYTESSEVMANRKQTVHGHTKRKTSSSSRAHANAIDLDKNIHCLSKHLLTVCCTGIRVLLLFRILPHSNASAFKAGKIPRWNSRSYRGCCNHAVGSAVGAGAGIPTVVFQYVYSRRGMYVMYGSLM